jgi:hypothetical protein
VVRWFRPSCPCDPAAKAWIEEKLTWLSDELPDNVFTGRRLVLPTPEFFPGRFDRTKATVGPLLERVCGYMDVAPSRIAVTFVAEEPNPLHLVNAAGQHMPTTAGTFQGGNERHAVSLSQSQLADPVMLVATMAHELAHVRLLGEGRVERGTFDGELLTDLTVVHLGLGIFLANTPRVWASQYTRWPGTDLRKPTYMTPPMYGWALAHIAWSHGDDDPPWADHLNAKSAADFRQGLRYLTATGDSTFHA